MSNGSAPPQWVVDAADTDLAALDQFAARWRAAHRGQWSEVQRLSGPCALLKRRVLEAMSGLPEPVEAGQRWDDLGVRTQQAGFTLAVARDLRRSPTPTERDAISTHLGDAHPDRTEPRPPRMDQFRSCEV